MTRTKAIQLWGAKFLELEKIIGSAAALAAVEQSEGVDSTAKAAGVRYKARRPVTSYTSPDGREWTYKAGRWQPVDAFAQFFSWLEGVAK